MVLLVEGQVAPAVRRVARGGLRRARAAAEVRDFGRRREEHPAAERADGVAVTSRCSRRRAGQLGVRSAHQQARPLTQSVELRGFRSDPFGRSALWRRVSRRSCGRMTVRAAPPSRAWVRRSRRRRSPGVRAGQPPAAGVSLLSSSTIASFRVGRRGRVPHRMTDARNPLGRLGAAVRRSVVTTSRDLDGGP